MEQVPQDGPLREDWRLRVEERMVPNDKVQDWLK